MTKLHRWTTQPAHRRAACGRAGMPATWTAEQRKEAIARDLEPLLNTRAARI